MGLIFISAMLIIVPGKVSYHYFRHFQIPHLQAASLIQDKASVLVPDGVWSSNFLGWRILKTNNEKLVIRKARRQTKMSVYTHYTNVQRNEQLRHLVASVLEGVDQSSSSPSEG